MQISVTAGSDDKIVIDFFTDDILEALQTIYGQLGSPLDPISIDPFVSSKISGINKIKSGSKVTIKLSDRSSKINAQLVYLKIQNLTTNHNGYMTGKMWRNYFSWDKGDELVCAAPNGCLYISPTNSNEICLQSNKINDSDEEIIICYTLVVCFTLNNKMIYCRVDPLAKVTSGSKQHQ